MSSTQASFLKSVSSMAPLALAQAAFLFSQASWAQIEAVKDAIKSHPAIASEAKAPASTQPSEAKEPAELTPSQPKIFDGDNRGALRIAVSCRRSLVGSGSLGGEITALELGHLKISGSIMSQVPQNDRVDFAPSSEIILGPAGAIARLESITARNPDEPLTAKSVEPDWGLAFESGQLFLGPLKSSGQTKILLGIALAWGNKKAPANLAQLCTELAPQLVATDGQGVRDFVAQPLFKMPAGVKISELEMQGLAEGSDPRQNLMRSAPTQPHVLSAQSSARSCMSTYEVQSKSSNENAVVVRLENNGNVFTCLPN